MLIRNSGQTKVKLIIHKGFPLGNHTQTTERIPGAPSSGDQVDYATGPHVTLTTKGHYNKTRRHISPT